MRRWRRVATSVVAAVLAALTPLGCREPKARPSEATTAPSVTVTPSTTTVVAPPATRSARIEDLPTDDAPPPKRLRLPTIGVDAPVLAVGVGANGELTVPTAETVGWYRFGSAPGRPGTAVLAAHVDFNGRPGAFFRLQQLRPGSRVEVVDGGAGVRRFRVVDVRSTPKTALADELFARDGEPRLALITCGGRFDRSTRHYEDNVIATAVPAEGDANP